MYEDVELIVGHYKVNKDSILKYDTDFTSFLHHRRPFRNCLPKKFFARLEIQGECWVWREGAPLGRGGRPYFNCFIGGQKRGASGRQLMWRFCGRPPVDSTTPTCGNPRCLRPSHLREGRAERPPQTRTRIRCDARPPTNEVVFGSGPELGEWLKTPGRPALELGHGIPCKPALFWFRVRVAAKECWEWHGPVSARTGPYWCASPEPGQRPKWRSARRAVARWSGKDGGLDWVKTFVTCGNNLCVNPDHIEHGVGRMYKKRKSKPKDRTPVHFRKRAKGAPTETYIEGEELWQIELREKGYI